MVASTAVPLILAHRGLRYGAPEHSRKAFTDLAIAATRLAKSSAPRIRLGVELDVRQMGDGTLVVNHDASFRRRMLQAHTYQEFREMFGADVPMRLDETLLILSAVPLACRNFELKEEHCAAAATRALVAANVQNVLVSSFSERALEIVHEEAPQYRRGLLTGNLPEILRSTSRRMRAFERTGADVLIPRQVQIRPDLGRIVEDLGKSLGVYTVNNEKRLQRYAAEPHFEFVVTDHPERLEPSCVKNVERIGVGRTDGELSTSR